MAEGSADVYPRFGPTCEWDTGAGHAVLKAAGGDVVTPDGEPFLYGKSDTDYLNGAFVAWGPAGLFDAGLIAVTSFLRSRRTRSGQTGTPGSPHSSQGASSP